MVEDEAMTPEEAMGEPLTPMATRVVTKAPPTERDSPFTSNGQQAQQINKTKNI